ncbi:hypothetical protein LTR09_006303 [Extremus antarcticus]|uniref:PD-(D/E)XK nuclease-like domain-containing protein n=1 Tax=Extremus antarcticus TaxID=702011 RepID=A0AAJ0DM01_9PEZI|nr:hypothetical protein LTR09_006303 [Extremus antarcticus]
MDQNIATPKKLRKESSDLSRDVDRTPRQPRAPGWTSPVSLPPPSVQGLDLRSVAFEEGSPDRGSESPSRSESSASTSSKKRKRTPSPRKNIGLRHAAYPVEPAAIKSWRAMPESMQSLTKSMMIYRTGRGIVSPNYPIETLSDGIDDEHLASVEREALGTCPRADWVEEVISSTEDCSTMRISEAGWNCEVHSRVLRQASRCSAGAHSARRLHWRNITTASIEPAELLPLTLESDSFQSRKADFALCLMLPADIERQLLRRGVYTLNPTFYEALRFSPLACSVETKLDGGNWDDAKTQIGTWASAQISHLQGLLRTVQRHTGSAGADGSAYVHAMDSMPALPFFIVQGRSWHFLYLQVMAERAVLWENIVVGDTTSPKGLHQVITALLEIMDWAEKVWRPWTLWVIDRELSMVFSSTL